MASYNRIIMMGNLTRDPEMKFIGDKGTSCCSFGLASNRRYSVNSEKREDVCFIDVTVFGRTADNCGQYLAKGSSVLVEGRLDFQQWETDGQRRSKHVIVADNVQFMPKRGGGDASTGEPDGMDDVPF